MLVLYFLTTHASYFINMAAVGLFAVGAVGNLIVFSRF